MIPLSDGAGEVAEVGPGVSRFKPGDRPLVDKVFPFQDARSAYETAIAGDFVGKVVIRI